MVTKLRLIQLLQLKMLKKLDRICSEFNLEYFIIAGTLLGAKRHNGFIPWDSDIDIAMLREDYDRLISNHKAFNEIGSIDAPEINPSCFSGFAKLKLKDTLFVEKGNHQDISGIYIDIFPLDFYNSNQNRYVNSIFHRCYKVLIRLRALKNGKYFSSSLPKSILIWILLFPFFFLPMKLVNKMIFKLRSKGSTQHKNYVNNFNSKYGLNRQLMSIEIYRPSSKIFFEGHEFDAPNKSDEWLRKIYGENWNFISPEYSINKTEKLLENYFIDFGQYEYLLNREEDYVRKELGIS